MRIKSFFLLNKRYYSLKKLPLKLQQKIKFEFLFNLNDKKCLSICVLAKFEFFC